MNEIFLKNEVNKSQENFLEETKSRLGIIYDNNENPELRVTEVKKRFTTILKYFIPPILTQEERNDLMMQIDSLTKITTKSDFINQALNALRPITTLRASDQSKFEQAQAQTSITEGGLTAINRLVAYNVLDSELHFHALAGETVKNKISLYRGALKDIANIINGNLQVKKVITITSHLVASHQGLFKKWGFTLEVSPNDGANRPSMNAYMSREDFLKKYLET